MDVTDTLPPFDAGPHDEYPVRVIVPAALAEYDRTKTLVRIVFLIHHSPWPPDRPVFKLAVPEESA